MNTATALEALLSNPVFPASVGAVLISAQRTWARVHTLRLALDGSRPEHRAEIIREHAKAWPNWMRRRW
ncbi:hypothetical protein [Streptomyces sp. NPDC090022]|uniref:hypothetical protein n=1 Tax=Streptomyces sp. NPDC090022 TaxID=3365920 RepID=UPI0037F8B627